MTRADGHIRNTVRACHMASYSPSSLHWSFDASIMSLSWPKYCIPSDGRHTEVVIYFFMCFRTPGWSLSACLPDRPPPACPPVCLTVRLLPVRLSACPLACLLFVRLRSCYRIWQQSVCVQLCINGLTSFIKWLNFRLLSTDSCPALFRNIVSNECTCRSSSLWCLQYGFILLNHLVSLDAPAGPDTSCTAHESTQTVHRRTIVGAKSYLRVFSAENLDSRSADPVSRVSRFSVCRACYLEEVTC